MSAPVPGADTRPLFTGDNNDDDGQVIDNFLIETDTPPTPVIEHISPAPLIAPKAATILRTGSYLLNLSYSAIKMISADVNRKELRLEGYSTVAAPTFVEYALVAFDAGLLTDSSAYHLRHGEKLNLDEHTGDVYILPVSTITAAFEVSYIAVTQ